MAKVKVKELVEYLKNLGVEDALIPALIMTASFESGMQTGVTGTNPNQTKDYGVFQVNVEEFYDDETDKPDDTITTFFEKVNKEYTKDELKDKLNNNEKFSGCTIHYVNSKLDEGKIICQESVPVLSDDTIESLSQRILEKEHIIYPKALQLAIMSLKQKEQVV